MAGISAACSVGNGSGDVSGAVTAPGCDLEATSYDLEPTFFGAEPVMGQLEIRVQRGSDFADKSDGVVILVRDASDVFDNQVGRAIPFTGEDDAPVRLNVYLNETCPPDRDALPVNLEATSGSITFQSIYAPEVDEDEVEIAATFEAHCTDSEEPDARFADLAGEFRFLYTRGRPAQPFP